VTIDRDTTFIPLIMNLASSSDLPKGTVAGLGFSMGVLGMLSVVTARSISRRTKD
jgi:hypothetical protein